MEPTPETGNNLALTFIMWLVPSGLAGAVVGWLMKTSRDDATLEARVTTLTAELVTMKATLASLLPTDKHENLTTICQQKLREEFRASQQAQAIKVGERLDNLNANVCKIMGALSLEPMDIMKRRRNSDYEGEIL